ncbi:MAG: phosphomannomutase, partial [bacterium]|nr:phosphomannomutase [bacterium]
MKNNIFRAYDIRGSYPEQLDAQAARLIGKAFASFVIRKYGIEHPRVIVGKDNRSHGPELQLAFIEGLLEHGAHVARVEDCPSPMLYHAVCVGGFDAGVNITASHNPADYNGFKLVGRQAHSICGEEIQIILKMIQEEDFVPPSEGEVQDISIVDSYFQALTDLVEFRRPLKIVIDAGNGIAGKYYPELFRRLGCEVFELYCEQDGSFPNHEPDPVVEVNTADLKAAVLEAR